MRAPCRCPFRGLRSWSSAALALTPHSHSLQEELTRHIAACAREKRLGEARETFRQLRDVEGLAPTAYTYSNLMNAHVASGDLAGATAAFADMQAAGFAPNVVVYTTLLKGYCAAGRLEEAWDLLETRMARGRPACVPDIRCCNTFLRGCVNVGDTAGARRLFEDRMRRWEVHPNLACYRYVARLLGQGLEVAALERLLQRLAAPPAVETERFRPACRFWAQGKCDRGVNCKFFHDPTVRQEDAEAEALERLDTEAACQYALAHAAALLGDAARARQALAQAERALAAAERRASAATSTSRSSARAFEGLRRQALGVDVRRLEAFLATSSSSEGSGRPEQAERQAAKRLARCFARTFVFSSRLDEPGPGEEGGDGGGDREVVVVPRKRCVPALSRALERTFGLGEGARRGLVDPAAVAKRLKRCFDRAGKLRWHKVFKGKERRVLADGQTREGLPVKLEVCAGVGDWAESQALADVGNACWAALELRHDRVYSIFSRMLGSGVPNFCALGGDAAGILRSHVSTGSVSHVFIKCVCRGRAGEAGRAGKAGRPWTRLTRRHLPVSRSPRTTRAGPTPRRGSSC